MLYEVITHLFDFERDIYGAHVQVSFLKKLREERRFESFAALVITSYSIHYTKLYESNIDAAISAPLME